MIEIYTHGGNPVVGTNYHKIKKKACLNPAPMVGAGSRASTYTHHNKEHF